jgi:NTP pyrophosphatase (non-canonical NTP hydrolase)
MTINELVADAHGRAIRKGWWDAYLKSGSVDMVAVRVTIPEKLCLIHSEVSEALDEYRNGHCPTETSLTASGKPEGLPSELADIIIRVADLCGALGIDLGEIIELKSRYNETRGYRHGSKLI